jgi:hypothetical protein
MAKKCSESCGELTILHTHFDDHVESQKSDIKSLESCAAIETALLKKINSELNDLIKPETGKVTILWEDRKMILNGMRWLIATVIAGLLTSIVTQNHHQNRIEKFLEKITSIEQVKISPEVK